MAAPAAWSQGVPDASVGLSIDESLLAYPYEFSESSSSFGTITSPDGTNTATALLGSDPYGYASGTGTATTGADANSDFSYEFEVVAPGGGLDPATIDMVSTLQDVSPEPSTTGPYIAQAWGALELGEYLSGGTIAEWETPENASGVIVSGTTDVDQAISISTDTIYQVIVGVHAESNVAGDTAYASVDPIISLDPSDPNSSLYTLVFSEGVTSPVPLPPALWLLLSGLAGLGFAWRFTGSRNRLNFHRPLPS